MSNYPLLGLGCARALLTMILREWSMRPVTAPPLQDLTEVTGISELNLRVFVDDKPTYASIYSDFAKMRED